MKILESVEPTDEVLIPGAGGMGPNGQRIASP
jgi:hypothetical protein